MQKEVAAQLGVNAWTYLKWEHDRTIPEAPYMPRVIAFLGYSPDPEPTTLPERLVIKRRTLGLTRKAAAQLLGVDEGTLARWERGEWKPTGRRQALVSRFLLG